MIRRGKSDGWLTLTPDNFLAWAAVNEVNFSATRPGSIVGRGAALLADHAIKCDDGAVNLPTLLKVPSSLILSLERVHEHAKTDRDFREVLDSIGAFGRTSRGAILTFLLFQASISCTSISEPIGVHGPFTEYVEVYHPIYVKSLPLESLPTFWSQPERQLLIGTTLAPAVAFKLRSLHREYDSMCASTDRTKWAQVTQGHVEFEDWLQVDAMYRSRALEFPGIGHCMIACLDLANHDPHQGTIAIYEKDTNGDATLLLRNGKELSEGDEVTITYGDEKGACEMLFSYGFLEADRQTAETLFLDLSIPSDDIARSAKLAIADCAPGVKIIDAGDGEIDWTGEFVWLLCVNQEDGLQFKIAQTVDDDGEEIHAFFGEHKLSNGATELHTLLGKHKLWDVYRLRAVAVLQHRVLEQMQVLFGTQEEQGETPRGDGTEIMEYRFHQAMQLRKLEFELLERAYGDFEKQKVELAESAVVKEYLAAVNGDELEDLESQAANADAGGLQQLPDRADDFS